MLLIVAEQPINVRIHDQVWNMFKTILFGFTTIFLAVAVDAVGGTGFGHVPSVGKFYHEVSMAFSTVYRVFHNS
jgi:hypothetical protein